MTSRDPRVRAWGARQLAAVTARTEIARAGEDTVPPPVVQRTLDVTGALACLDDALTRVEADTVTVHANLIVGGSALGTVGGGAQVVNLTVTGRVDGAKVRVHRDALSLDALLAEIAAVAPA